MRKAVADLAVQQGGEPAQSQPTSGPSKAVLPFPSKVAWRVTAPGPAGLGPGWSAQPS